MRRTIEHGAGGQVLLLQLSLYSGTLVKRDYSLTFFALMATLGFSHRPAVSRGVAGKGAWTDLTQGQVEQSRMQQFNSGRYTE